MSQDNNIDVLLTNYRLWGLAAIGSFVVFALLLTFVITAHGLHFIWLLMILMSGFLWIGTTAICRHSLVLLKSYIRKDIGIPEFLSTQLVVFLFPFTYRKVKREVDAYLKRTFITWDREIKKAE